MTGTPGVIRKVTWPYGVFDQDTPRPNTAYDEAHAGGLLGTKGGRGSLARQQNVTEWHGKD